jgi:hypothetical protein
MKQKRERKHKFEFGAALYQKRGQHFGFSFSFKLSANICIVKLLQKNQDFERRGILKKNPKSE